MTSDVRLGRIVGLPAVLGGKLLGHVERAVLTGDGTHLRGLVIRRGLGSARWAGRGDIGVIGDVSVILGQRPARLPRDTDFALSTVKDESGLTLGRVTDVWISPESLAVTALEVTLGLYEELRSGRLTVRRWAVQPDDGDGAQVLIPREEWEVTQ